MILKESSDLSSLLVPEEGEETFETRLLVWTLCKLVPEQLSTIMNNDMIVELNNWKPNTTHFNNWKCIFLPFKIERYSCQGPNIALDNLVNYCMTNSNVSDVSQSTAILLLSRRSARFLLIVDLLSLLHQLALLGSRRLLVPSHPEKSSRPLTWPQKLTNCQPLFNLEDCFAQIW